MKEFVEYQKKIPYSVLTICNTLTKYARKYVQENNQLNNIHTKERDIILTDIINYIGYMNNCDMALIPKDLHNDKEITEDVPADILLTTLVNNLANYIFKYDLFGKIYLSNPMNKLKNNLNYNDSVLIIINFINYISKTNQFERTFTIRDLYEKYKEQDYNSKMTELKDFLILTDSYNKKLINGETLIFLFQEIAAKHNLKYISNDGKYHYIDSISESIGRSEMFSFDSRKLDNELNALAYAYYKLTPNEMPIITVIKKKIKEMKR